MPAVGAQLAVGNSVFVCVVSSSGIYFSLRHAHIVRCMSSPCMPSLRTGKCRRLSLTVDRVVCCHVVVVPPEKVDTSNNAGLARSTPMRGTHTFGQGALRLLGTPLEDMQYLRLRQFGCYP